MNMMLNKTIKQTATLASLLLSVSCAYTYATDYSLAKQIELANDETAACNQCDFTTAILGSGRLATSWIEATDSAIQLRLKSLDSNDLSITENHLSQTLTLDGASASAPRILPHANGNSIYWVEDKQSINTATFTDLNNPLDAPISVVNSASQIASLDIVKLNNGSRLLVWSSSINLEERQIYALKLDENNQVLGSVLTLSTATNAGNGAVKVFPLPTNSFYIAYENIDPEGNIKISVDHYSEDGALINEQATVILDSPEDDLQVSGAIMADSSILLTWLSGSLDDSTVYAQRFDANGLEDNTPFVLLNTTEKSVSRPDVHALDDGNFLFTWRE